MRILMVASYLPYPLFNGGNIRLYNLIKNLSKNHEITLVCEKRKYQTENDIDELRKFCKIVTVFPRQKQWSLKNILRSAFSKDPFLVIGHTMPKMREYLRHELIEKNFDLIHIETFYVLQNLPSTTLPIVIAEHNVEYLVYQRFANETLAWIRPLLNIDIRKMKNQEILAWKSATKLIAVSKEEQEIMQSEINSKVEIIPNGVDLEAYKFVDSKEKINIKEKRVLFIGDFKWIENRNSAEWILKSVWPKIKNKLNTKLWIVGRNIPDPIKKLAGDDVIFSSNLSDTSEIYRKAYVLLSPIKIGGGTSFKILEAMASGVPVVTTKLGAEGIGDSLLVSESSQGLADLVEDLYFNSDRYEKVAKDAREKVEKDYDWRKISANLEKVYKGVVND